MGLLRDWIRRMGTARQPQGAARRRAPVGVEELEDRSVPAILTVTNTLDGGAGSLRNAITQANAMGGADVIQFNIAGAGVKTINVLSALPTITETLTINGATQPGFSSTPLIELNGASAGGTTHGLNSVAQLTVRSLTINRFGGSGILLNGAGANGSAIVGNFLGTNNLGTAAQGNRIGLEILDADNVMIGGAAAADGNTISGNTKFGAVVYGLANDSVGNTFRNNRIGTNAAGTAGVANIFDGLLFAQGGNGNFIGSTAGDRNVISGNGRAGVHLYGTVSGNVVQGNFIGTAANGFNALANTIGVWGAIGANNNVIGGASAGARNTISGNAFFGVWLSDVGTTANSILGNRIGTNFAGTAAVANGSDGVLIFNGANGNIVGGTVAGAGNQISGNGRAGVYLFDADNNTVARNNIGMVAAQNAKLGNKLGVWMSTGATGNNVGFVDGGGVAHGNLISGNAEHGVLASDFGTSGNGVSSNLIGLDGTGLLFTFGNGLDGVAFTNGASNNTVGGTLAANANTIGANLRAGVYMHGAGTNNNTVAGNRIGIDVNTNFSMPNLYGVWILGGSSFNNIGLAVVGGGNFISSSDVHGVFISDVGTAFNTVRNNIIGTNAASDIERGARYDGVVLYNGASNNTVGGTGLGRNVISGNLRMGVNILGAGTNNNSVDGNLIGTTINGIGALPNLTGVSISNGAQGNRIGVTAGNVISGNVRHGVEVLGAAAQFNSIQRNLIGLNLNTAALANGIDGVFVSSVSRLAIGGAGQGNTIAGNTRNGVTLVNSSNVTIQGNNLGLQTSPTTGIGNGNHGLLITGGSATNTVGGTTGGLGNAIVFNGDNGVVVGSDSGQGFNAPAGVGNAIVGNSIHSNAGGLAIDLGPRDGLNANDPADPDTGPNNLQNHPLVTVATFQFGNTQVSITFAFNSFASTTYRIEFFASFGPGFNASGQGGSFLGFMTVFTDVAGNAAGNIVLPISPALQGNHITATATNLTTGDTSEFSLPFVAL